MNDDIGVAQRACHERLVAHVPFDEFESGMRTEVKQTLLSLAVEQIIDGFDAMTGIEEMLAQNASEITESSRHENALAHPRPPCRGRRAVQIREEAAATRGARLPCPREIWQR